MSEDVAALLALAGVGVGLGLGFWMGARLVNAIWRHVLGDATAFARSIWHRPPKGSDEVGGEVGRGADASG